MLRIEPAKVLMCVSPGEDFEAALDFTVAEATRRGCGVHLALAVRPVWVGPPDVADLRLVEGEWRKYGTDFLVDCERRVSKEIGVDTHREHGDHPWFGRAGAGRGEPQRRRRRDAAPPHGSCRSPTYVVGHQWRGRPCARTGRGGARLLARGRPAQ